RRPPTPTLFPYTTLFRSDGSFNGAMSLWQEHNFPVIGIPGTIDNDISNTEYTIGFDTAVQTAIEAVDRVRDTAHSHARTFLVERSEEHTSELQSRGHLVC